MRKHRFLQKFIIVFVALSGSNLTAQQQFYFGAEKIVVVLNPLTDIPEKEFPYDRNFFIRKYLHKADSNTIISATLLEVKDEKKYDIDARNIFEKSNYDGVISLDTGIKLVVKSAVDRIDSDKLNGFDLFVSKPLKPNRQYDIVIATTPDPLQRAQLAEIFFQMHYRGGGNVANIVNSINKRKKQQLDATPIEEFELIHYYQQHLQSWFLATALCDTTKLRKELVKSLQSPKEIEETITSNGNSTIIIRTCFERTHILYNSSTFGFKLDTRAKSRIQPDFGAVVYGMGGDGYFGINQDFFGIAPYVGINYLFRPFDPDVRLKQLPKNHVHWYNRFSVHSGLVLTSLAKDRYRSNLIGSFNLMLGGGYRLNSSLKVVSGVIFYRRINDNPLYIGSSVHKIGYLGLSVDLRVREAIGDIGKLLFSSK